MIRMCCKDIACAHASMSLEEVRNRRVFVREGDHVEYDQVCRNSEGTDSESSTDRTKKLPGYFDIQQRMGAIKSQFNIIVGPIVNLGGEFAEK
ncbi:hypothetical protein FGB62_22g848 [Gracilaria domingensis]|nr:hypothetical protein FGB62_22g848 [Gracilaria domingensis]